MAEFGLSREDATEALFSDAGGDLGAGPGGAGARRGDAIARDAAQKDEHGRRGVPGVLVPGAAQIERSSLRARDDAATDARARGRAGSARRHGLGRHAPRVRTAPRRSGRLSRRRVVARVVARSGPSSSRGSRAPRRGRPGPQRQRDAETRGRAGVVDTLLYGALAERSDARDGKETDLGPVHALLRRACCGVVEASVAAVAAAAPPASKKFFKGTRCSPMRKGTYYPGTVVAARGAAYDVRYGPGDGTERHARACRRRGDAESRARARRVP